MAITPPEYPTGPPISGSERRASRAARHSGTAFSTSGRTSRSTISSHRLAGLHRPAQVGAGLLGGGGTGPVTAPGELDGGRGEALRRGVPGPGHQSGVHLVQSAGVAEQDQRGRCGADPGVHRMPGISPRVNSRSRTPSSRRCSEVNCMVVPFGSARERRSRTTYRPTVTPEGSTHVDTFTGTTSSFSRTASGRLAVGWPHAIAFRGRERRGLIALDALGSRTLKLSSASGARCRARSRLPASSSGLVRALRHSGVVVGSPQ